MSVCCRLRLSALHPGVRHAILIGDHKQLRPSTSHYDLSRKYKLDVSLFERMIFGAGRAFSLLVFSSGCH